METSKRKRLMAEINVVPYIDVMLVLLVIFMITTPLLTQGVSVKLPEAQARAIDTEEQEPIVISIDAARRYYLNLLDHPSEPVAVEALVSRVASEMQNVQSQGKHRQVLIKGDKEVDYGRVVEVMALLQQAGVTNVGLITANPSASPVNQ